MPDFEFDNLAGGLNYRDTDVTMGKNQSIYWIESTNVKPYFNTGLERCRGNLLIVDHGTNIISAGNYSVGNQEYIMFADANGDVYEYDSEGASKSSALVTGLHISARGAWVPYGKGIIYSNGTDEPFIYFRSRSTTVTGTAGVTNESTTVTGSGTSFDTELQAGDSIEINGETHIIDSVTNATTLDTRANFAATASGEAVTRNKITWLIAVGADGETLRSTAIASYKGRVYMGYQGGIYWTAQGTYTDWTTADDAGYNKNFFNESSTIDALSIFGNYLAIHRKEQVILLEDVDGTTVNFVFDIKANRGSQSQFGITTVQNDHIFFDSGLWPLGKTGVLDQIVLKAEISSLINNDSEGFLKGRIDTARLDEVTILHNRNQREIWCYFPITNLTYLQYVYVFGYQEGIWYRRYCPQNTTCAIEHRNFIYSFDSNGKIYKEDVGSTWNSVDLDFYIQTAYLNFGEGHQEKDIDEIKIIVDTGIENDFDYKYFFNYDTFFASNVQNLSITGDPDCLIWSDDDETNTDTVWANDAETTGNDWATEVLDGGWLDSYNGFKSFSLHFSGGGATQDLGIIGLKFLGVVVNSA